MNGMGQPLVIYFNIFVEDIFCDLNNIYKAGDIDYRRQCTTYIYIYIYIYERETSVCMCYTITVKQKTQCLFDEFSYYIYMHMYILHIIYNNLYNNNII